MKVTRTVMLLMTCGEHILLLSHPGHDGKFMGPGGHVNEGEETLTMALRRELHEETGIELREMEMPTWQITDRARSVVQPLACVEYLTPGQIEESHIYWVDVPKSYMDKKLMPEDGKVFNLGWYPLSDVMSFPMYEDTKSQIQCIKITKKIRKVEDIPA